MTKMSEVNTLYQGPGNPPKGVRCFSTKLRYPQAFPARYARSWAPLSACCTCHASECEARAGDTMLFHRVFHRLISRHLERYLKINNLKKVFMFRWLIPC